jgi:hypothetical protein
MTASEATVLAVLKAAERGEDITELYKQLSPFEVALFASALKYINSEKGKTT